MDKRVMVKQYIDMDELCRPWESENKLITPAFIQENTNKLDIVNYLTNIKELYTLNEKQDVKGKVLKK